MKAPGKLVTVVAGLKPTHLRLLSQPSALFEWRVAHLHDDRILQTTIYCLRHAPTIRTSLAFFSRGNNTDVSPEAQFRSKWYSTPILGKVFHIQFTADFVFEAVNNIFASGDANGSL